MNEKDRFNESYKENIANGLSEDDAYTEAYSFVCSQACDKYGVLENGDGSLD